MKQTIMQLMERGCKEHRRIKLAHDYIQGKNFSISPVANLLFLLLERW